ncbi:MAG: NAD(P)-dependent oxidoreductase [Pseudomonadota bacterium]
MTNTVLVTGSGGFLGDHCAQLFAQQGWSVLGLGPNTSGSHYCKTQTGRLDSHTLQSLGEGRRIDAIVHAAGGASVRQAELEPDAEYADTVTSTQILVDWVAQQCPGVRIVYLSSAAVYGDPDTHGEPLSENDPRTPISNYGAHKLEAENLILDLARHSSGTCAIVRFFSIFGAGLRKQILWDIANKAAAGAQVSLMGSGHETRDFLHVTDAARLLVQLAQPGQTESVVVNGGTGNATSTRALATGLVEQLTAIDPAYQSEIVFDRPSPEGDPAHLIADTQKLADFGFTHTVSLSEGMEGYAHWFHQQRV